MPSDGVILHGVTVIDFHDAVYSFVGDIDVGWFLMMALIEIEPGLNIVDEPGRFIEVNKAFSRVGTGAVSPCNEGPNQAVITIKPLQ